MTMQKPVDILYFDSDQLYHSWMITRSWQVILFDVDGTVSDIRADVGLTGLSENLKCCLDQNDGPYIPPFHLIHIEI
jgi:hypothetical protein